MVLPALIGGGSALLGGIFRNRAESRANKRNIAEAQRAERFNLKESRRAEKRADKARENTFIDIRNAAIKGGFNPLTALGSGAMGGQSQFPSQASSAFFSPQTGMGDAIASAGAIVADAVQQATLTRAAEQAKKAETAIDNRQTASGPVRLPQAFSSDPVSLSHVRPQNMARQQYVDSRTAGEQFKVDFPVTLLDGRTIEIPRNVAEQLDKQRGDYLLDSDISSIWGFGASEAISSGTPWLQNIYSGRPEPRPVNVPRVDVPLNRLRGWLHLGQELVTGKTREQRKLDQIRQYQEPKPEIFGPHVYQPLRLQIN